MIVYGAAFHADQMNKPQHREVAEAAFRRQVGRPVLLRAIVGAPKGRAGAEESQLETARQEALVRAAIEELGATIVKVERQ